DVLAKSSNVGAIKVAHRLRPEDFISYIKGFGFGRRTGIDLPGESGGLLREVEAWSGLSQASLSIGQEIGVTTLQLAAMFGAVANDGVWMRPRIVKTLLPAQGGRAPVPLDEDAIPTQADVDARAPSPGSTSRGAVVPDFRRVVSEKTARLLRVMLQSVTTE